MIHIMLSLPTEYDDVVRDMKRMMRSGLLTVDETEKLLIEKYRLLQKRNNWERQEIALATKFKGKKTYKGRCSHCGMFGHKAVDCFEREEN